MTIGDIVPAGTLDLLGEEISRIAAKSDGSLLLGLGVRAVERQSRHEGESSMPSTSSMTRKKSADSYGSMLCRYFSRSAPLPVPD